MITKVLIWSRLDPTGHVAIASGRNYYSFHPRDRKNIQTVTGSPAYNGTPEEDGRPTRVIPIDGLDELAMAEQMDRFEDHMRSGKLVYRLMDTNCSYVAARLLYAGTPGMPPFPKHKSMSQLFSAIAERRHLRHDHGRLAELAREHIEDGVIMCARRNRPVGTAIEVALGVLLLADVATREFVWSPGDVQNLAKDLAQRLGGGSAQFGSH